MNLFYHPEAAVGMKITLDASEASHITKAFRKKDGDVVHITDGKGNLYSATLEIAGRQTNAFVSEITDRQSEPHLLEIAISPTKNNERTEWFIEKAVEIGIGKISLIECEHSERSHLKTDRLVRVAISAMKQSLKTFLPEISPLQSFEDWVKNANNQSRFIAHCIDSRNKKLLKDVLKSGTTTCIAIGPEGDFSLKELELARAMGFEEISLGSSRLRTETAALVAVNTFEIINQ